MNSAKPPPPPQRPATSRPPPPPPLRSTKPAAPGSVAPVPAAVSVRAPAAEGPVAMVSVSPVASAASAAPAHPAMAATGQETRLRVSVKLSVRDPNLLIARPLGAGEAAPPGTREAVLVLVEPATNLPAAPDGGSTP
jgi:hypothetical protein